MAATFAAEHGVGRTDIFMLDVRDIVIDWRKNISRAGEPIPIDDELIALAHSMMPKTGRGDTDEGTTGQLNPVSVRMLGDRRPELVGGFRRARAAMYLVESGLCPDFKLKCCKCNLSDVEAALANMDENMQRSDPKPIQLAHAIRSLHEDMGMAIAVIAKRLRKSPEYLGSLLKLVGLPGLIQDAVSNGEMSASAAVELTTLPEKAAIEVFNDAKESAGKRVKAKDVKAATTPALAPADLPTPTGTAPAAARVGSGKGPVINASDVKQAKQKKVDAAINAGEQPPVEAKPRNRSNKEILAFFQEMIDDQTATPEGLKVAKVIAKFIKGEATADQMRKFWDKHFMIK